MNFFYAFLHQGFSITILKKLGWTLDTTTYFSESVLFAIDTWKMVQSTKNKGFKNLGSSEIILWQSACIMDGIIKLMVMKSSCLRRNGWDWELGWTKELNWMEQTCFFEEGDVPSIELQNWPNYYKYVFDCIYFDKNHKYI